MNPTTRRRPGRARWATAGGVAALLVLAACGRGDPGGDQAAGGGGGGGGGECAASDGPVELTFWSWVPGMDQAVELWNQENPEIQVRVTETPAGNAGTYQNLFNALRADQAPDLSQIEYDSLASFRLQGGLQDISGCDATASAQDDFVDWTHAQASFGEDALFAVPQDTGPMAMIYRTDVFERAGVTEPPATWQEYEDAARQVKQATGADITFFPQGDANWFTGLLWQRGAQLFGTSGDTWTVDVDSPEAQEVAEYW